MPHKPLPPCAVNSCPNRAANGRYCADHAKTRKTTRQHDNRPSPSRRGYGRRWQNIRAMYLRKYKTCVVCGREANEVDHITPLADGGNHQWENLQAMCKSCHSRKTAMFDGGFGRRDRR